MATRINPGTAREMLAFDGACLVLDPGMPPTKPLWLGLTAGDLVLVDATDGHRVAAFADAAVGLTPPAAGQVRFLGRSWSELDADAGNAMRGRIGRLVGHGGWIEYLSVRDNMLLGQLHHTNRREGLLMDDAARVSRLFGLPGIPLARPSDLNEGDLHRAGLVRAFIGRPQLILLERPTQFLYPEIMEPLINAIRSARDRGAAVLWLTLDPNVWRDASVPATRRLRLIGGELFEGQRAS